MLTAGHKRGSKYCAETQGGFRDTDSYAALQTLKGLPDKEEAEEEGDVDNDEEEDRDGDEDDDARKAGSGQTETGHTAKASVNDSTRTSNCQEEKTDPYF